MPELVVPIEGQVKLKIRIDMEVIIYKGNQIHAWKNGKFSAYIMDRYGDIEEYTKDTLEEAKEIIDKHVYENQQH